MDKTTEGRTGGFEFLPNGALLLVRKTGFNDRRFVLAYTGNEAAEPFVTWEEGDGGYMFSGHYFSDPSRAADDLLVRVRRGY